MADEIGKVYNAEVIEENAFPQAVVATQAVTESASGGTYKAATIEEQPLPTKRVATELLSSALNTKSKKILQEFQFAVSGALQIGDYKEGTSGDVRISPNGIVGRDISGNVTFSIDALTGSAVFAGSIQTGTVIAGVMVLGDSSIIIDGVNKRQIWFADDGLAAIVIGNA